MLRVLRYSASLLLAYLSAWTAAYSLVIGLDFRYVYEYFGLAWSFSGGEIPTFIWWFSIVAFVPIATVAVLLMQKLDQHVRRSA